MEKNIEQHLELLEEVKQRPSTTDNVVNIYTCSGSYFAKNVVNLLLDLDNRVDVAHDKDLEVFLSAMSDNDEYEVMVRMEKLLIKKEDDV